jgi:uncharacterized protein YjbJ (UPF0337 family)
MVLPSRQEKIDLIDVAEAPPPCKRRGTVEAALRTLKNTTADSAKLRRGSARRVEIRGARSGAGLAHLSFCEWAARRQRVAEEEGQMAGKTDKAKGRIKEAAGALSGDKALKREGKLDQIVGSVKDAVGTAVNTVRDVLTGAPATVKKAARRAR